MIDVKYIYGDDWAGVYINNILKIDGHTVRFEEGFKTVCNYINDFCNNISYIKFASYEIDLNWIEEQGDLPEKFEDIPEDVLEMWS